jgi:hypothetical protein
MTDRLQPAPRSGARGCATACAGVAALVLLAPFAFTIRVWRRWRRGRETSFALDASPGDPGAVTAHARFDATLDLPEPVSTEVRRRITATIVRIAQVLRTPDESLCAVYRLRSDPEPYLIAIGPQMQRLGDRFLLTLTQGALAGRTVVWLALDANTALAEVVDPETCDPEDHGELERLLVLDRARWSMATSWARVGPSWVFRVILVVPPGCGGVVRTLLEELEHSS